MADVDGSFGANNDNEGLGWVGVAPPRCYYNFADNYLSVTGGHRRHFKAGQVRRFRLRLYEKRRATTDRLLGEVVARIHLYKRLPDEDAQSDGDPRWYDALGCRGNQASGQVTALP